MVSSLNVALSHMHYGSGGAYTFTIISDMDDTITTSINFMFLPKNRENLEGDHFLLHLHYVHTM